MKKLIDTPVDVLQKRKENLEEKLSGLREQYEVISNKIGRLVTRIKSIDEVLDEKTLDKNDIEKLLEIFPETKSRRKLLSDFLKPYGLSSSGGYFLDTEQVCIRISLEKHNDELTEKVHKGIIKLLPFIKPLDDGSKTFKIFEHTLSRHASYYLKVSEGDYYISNERSIINSIVYSKKDLLEVLKYIQQYLYYE